MEVKRVRNKNFLTLFYIDFKIKLVMTLSMNIKIIPATIIIFFLDILTPSFIYILYTYKS